jgi:hypothetical protein
VFEYPSLVRSYRFKKADSMRIAVRASPCHGRFDASVRALAEGVVLSRVSSWVMFLLF